MLRYDHSTGQSRIITVWPEDQYGSALKDVKYRFPFTYPIALSSHDGNTLYAAANRVFKSTNQGDSWDIISPDLTTQDESKMQDITGGLITSHGLSSQFSSVIYAFAESRREAGVLWAGTDDRQIHLSKDGGETWQDVSPTNLPRWTCISTIEPSPHDPGTVYVAAHRYKLDDHRPFLLKTTDYGASWQMITSGIRRNDFARVIREDPSRPGLLYAGTETGVYVSINGGETWQPMKLNLPAVAVHDMHVKDGDLVLATHGRGFWVLDNLSPLRQLSDEALDAPAHLFRPPDTPPGKPAPTLEFAHPTRQELRFGLWRRSDLRRPARRLRQAGETLLGRRGESSLWRRDYLPSWGTGNRWSDPIHHGRGWQ